MEGNGRRRRDKKPWEKIEVKGGGGGILILGGVLVAAAIGAGTAFAARKAQRRRPRPSVNDASEKEEKIKNFEGERERSDEAGDGISVAREVELTENRQRESEIDRAVNTQDNNSISKILTSKNLDVVETKKDINDGRNDVKELPIGINLDMDISSDKILGETDCVIQNGVGEKEFGSTVSQMREDYTLKESDFVLVEGKPEEIEINLIEYQTDVAQNWAMKLLEKTEVVLVHDIKEEKEISPTESLIHVSEIALVHEEKEDEEASSSESDHGMRHDQTGQIVEKSVVALEIEEKEDEVSAEKPHIDITESDDAKTACIREVDGGIQSANSQFSTECQMDSVGDETVFSPAEEIEKEVLPSNSKLEITQDQSATSEESNPVATEERDELEVEKTSTIVLQEESEPEQVVDEYNQEKDDKEILPTESEYGASHSQAEQITEETGLAYDIKEKDEKEFYHRPTQSNSIESRFSNEDCKSNLVTDEFATEKAIEKEEEELSPTEHQREMNECRPETSPIVLQEESEPEQVVDKYNQEKGDKEILPTESEYGMSHSQAEQITEESGLAYDIKEKDEEESYHRPTESNSIESRFSNEDCKSNLVADEFATEKAIEKEEEELSPTEHQLEMNECRPETSPIVLQEESEPEQVVDEYNQEKGDKEIFPTESEYGVSHSQAEQITEESGLAYDIKEKDEEESYHRPTESNSIESRFSNEDCKSNLVTDEFAAEKAIEKEEEESPTEHQLEMNECQPEPNFETSIQNVVDEIEEDDEEESEELESLAEETREEGFDSPGVSSAESNAEAIWPIELIEQKKILPVEQLKDVDDQLKTSGEIKDVMHANEEEKQKETILVKEMNPAELIRQEKILKEIELKGLSDKLNTSGEIEEEILPEDEDEDGDDYDDDEEEKEQKESVKEKEATNMASRDKASIINGLIMDQSKRLLLLFVVMALTLAILSLLNSGSFQSSHFTKLASEFYQIIFPSDDSAQEM
ncbi:hypothetical protein Cni_G27674 [Canna indica]|uniref:Uncharacterized protein n=1 Tax=Canna indica TaxID=4628 RepID=A0AAQ3L474_9LILI|nr:hypothetical protein Cni_G27674 [Canna indica]